MESPILFTHVSFVETAAAYASGCVAALRHHRQAVTDEMRRAFPTPRTPTPCEHRPPHEEDKKQQQEGEAEEGKGKGKGKGEGEEEAKGTPSSSSAAATRRDLLLLHAAHRRRLYLCHARALSHGADTHALHRLLRWCHDRHLFLHPSLRPARRTTAFRDHAFYVDADVPRLTPLLAIPEVGVLGLREADPAGGAQNGLYDAQRTRDFHACNGGSSGGGAPEEDVCQFFFNSLGMLVSDLVTAKSSPLSDVRCCFAESLTRLRTLQNAPYFEEDVVFNSDETCLADVLLQMIRNYIRGGPLVNKIPMEELRWAVSICLSHSTPLCIDSVRSIGILPIIHMFPHGGEGTNAYLVARTSRRGASQKMSAFFRNRFGYDFDSIYDGKWIYLIPDRPLRAGEEICLQAMAPVCDKNDVEAQQMWRLSCGSAPSSYKTTAEVAKHQAKLTAEVISLGEEYLAREQQG